MYICTYIYIYMYIYIILMYIYILYIQVTPLGLPSKAVDDIKKLLTR